MLNSSLLFIALFSNVSFFVDCCPTIKVTLQNTPKETLERFEGLYNLIGYVNGEKYWLSQDKKWTIYMSGNQNWIIGTLEALGTPRDINAWLYTAASSCPEIDMWKYFWDSSKKEFVPSETEEAIQVECANQHEIELQDGQFLSNDPWLDIMTKEKVDGLIKNSTGE